MKNYRSKLKNVILTLLVILLAVFLFFVLRSNEPAYGSLDEFTQCLTDRGVVMYGADWCPHCQNEKKAFGDSFRLVNYVECPDNPKLCLEKEIQGYPTWIFSNGKKLEGEQGLERLSNESSCPLPD